MKKSQIFPAIVLVGLFLTGCLQIQVTDGNGDVHEYCLVQSEPSNPAGVSPTELPESGVGSAPSEGGEVAASSTESTTLEYRLCDEPDAKREISIIRYFRNGGYDQVIEPHMGIGLGTLLEKIDFTLDLEQSVVTTATSQARSAFSLSGLIQSRNHGTNVGDCTYKITDLRHDIPTNKIEGLRIDHSEYVCLIGMPDSYLQNYVELTLTDVNGHSDSGRYGCQYSPRAIDMNQFNAYMEAIADSIKNGNYANDSRVVKVCKAAN